MTTDRISDYWAQWTEKDGATSQVMSWHTTAIESTITAATESIMSEGIHFCCGKSLCYSCLLSLWLLKRQWKRVHCCHGYTVASRSQCLHKYKQNIWQYPIHVYPTRACRSCQGNNSCATAVRQVLFHVCRSGCGNTRVDYCTQRCMFKKASWSLCASWTSYQATLHASATAAAY